jgi:NAD(P)-dependent dehydrogenase (short-subunit alcohol dehydrogenase family)
VPKPWDLGGKVAVVTGACGILGSLYCRRLSAQGAKVVVADISEDRCTELARSIRVETGGEVIALAVDLADEQSTCAWAELVLAGAGQVDVLVNNAAAKSPGFFAPLDRFTLADWNAVMTVNVTGMFLVTREIGPSMVRRGSGSIINVSSIYGVVGPDQRIYEGSWDEELGGQINTPLVYSASKGAVIAMTRYLATYWGPRGVRTNTLTPGGVLSGQNSVFSEKYGERVPLGRMATAEDMVGALLFLASDASAYVNGHNLVVDGGWTAW